MNKMKRKIFNLVLIIVVFGILIPNFYMFYIAPCLTVKNYWFIVQTPGRCLNVEGNMVVKQYVDIINHPRVGPDYVYPNSTLTPGATNPDVTQKNINKTICVAGWTKTIRPPSSYTTKLKIKQIKQYGYQDTKIADYEEDHFISLELGGHPTSPENLWPESYTSNPNARNKDAVENYLHKQLCAGTITLKEAQKEISTDWVTVYNKIQKTTASTFGVLETVGIDSDDN